MYFLFFFEGEHNNYFSQLNFFGGALKLSTTRRLTIYILWFVSLLLSSFWIEFDTITCYYYYYYYVFFLSFDFSPTPRSSFIYFPLLKSPTPSSPDPIKSNCVLLIISFLYKAKKKTSRLYNGVLLGIDDVAVLSISSCPFILSLRFEKSIHHF